MKLHRETRRRWDFEVDKTFAYAADGIMIKAGVASFPREVEENEDCGWKLFKSQEDCVKWFDENMPVKETGGHVKTLYDVKTVKLSPDKNNFDLIKKFMLAPENFKPEDVLAYKSYLAHNFADRDGQRFSLPALKSLNATIVGKSKLMGHERPNPGFGRYFKSELVEMSADDCITMLKEKVGKKVERNIRLAEKIDGAIYWMVPSFYMLADDSDIAKRLDAGIYFFESIGFGCRNLVEYRDPNDENKVLWHEYVNTDDDEAEAREGSIVWLGSQFGAGARKAFGIDGETDVRITTLAIEDVTKPYPNEHACRIQDPGQFSRFISMQRKYKGKTYRVLIGYRPDGSSDDQAYRYPIDNWNEDQARSHCSDHGGKFEPAAKKEVESPKEGNQSKTGGIMKVKILAIEKDIELNEKSIGEFATEVSAEWQKDVDKGKKAEDVLKALKTIVGDDYSAEKHNALKKQAEIGAKLHEKMIDEAVSLSVLAKLTDNTEEKTKAEKDFMRTLSLEQLEAQVAKLKKAVGVNYPIKEQLDSNLEKKTLDTDDPYRANY